MTLADFIEAKRERLVELWKRHAVERLAHELDESQLIDELPQFIEDLVITLRHPAGEWPKLESAEQHGRQRVAVGVDIAGLTEEMALVIEALVELAGQEDFELATADMRKLIRVMGRATARSVHAYAELRDKQLADEAAQHFSFIAHEIRNPLNSARVVTEMLDIAPEEQRKGHLRRLHRALLRLSTQVDLALVEARLYGETRLELQRIAVDTLVDAAWEDVSAQAEERGVTLTRRLEPFEFEADRRLVTSALTNLLSNAIKFSCPGGRVAVQARNRDEHVLFEVEDECGGLPEDVQQHLLQSAGSENSVDLKNSGSQGAGLGLTIVKQVADAHHGEIRISNREGKGCCFVLDIPWLHQTTTESTATSSPKAT